MNNVIKVDAIRCHSRLMCGYNSTVTQIEYEQSLAEKDAELKSARQSVQRLNEELLDKQAQLDWLKKELFGPRNEKRRPIDDRQLSLFEKAKEENKSEQAPSVEIKAHKRRGHKKNRDGSEVTGKGLRFDEDVPVKTIEHSCPELNGADADLYEIVRYEYTHHLASRPGSKVVLRHSYPVVKRKGQSTFIQPKAIEGVLGQAQVDVSALADMLVEKFIYHLPLYRQHQRLQDQGFKLARASLGNWVAASIQLLKPIAESIRESILQGEHAKLDETPIKAGRTKGANGKGKMKSGWLWPLLGETGDIYFHYNASRGKKVVEQLLDGFHGTLQTDGYEAYARFCEASEHVRAALCWSHTRRGFLKAEKLHPKEVRQILCFIGLLYRIEGQLRESGADNDAILRTRRYRSKRCVDKIFRWITHQIERPELLPKDPLRKALHYAQNREAGLRAFLDDAWLALDTNDLERRLRVIPMGRKNWLFCTSEVGAEHVATIQTLLATCRAHDVHPYHYLVDVLQRVSMHPASQVHELTPREWQKRFADNPLVSLLSSAT